MSQSPQGNPPKFMRFCDTFGEFFIINLLFVITSIPIITIGASANALCTYMIRYAENREGKVVKTYFTEFKKGFLKSTYIWLVYIVIALLVMTELMILTNSTGNIRVPMVSLLILEALFTITTFPFVFWMNARYENTIPNLFKNSMILFIKRFFSWFRIVIIWVGPVVFFWYFPQIFFKTWFLWVTILISFLTYVTALLMKKEFFMLEGYQSLNYTEESQKEGE